MEISHPAGGRSHGNGTTDHLLHGDVGAFMVWKAAAGAKVRNSLEKRPTQRNLLQLET